jgi:hypothetical protein
MFRYYTRLWKGSFVLSLILCTGLPAGSSVVAARDSPALVNQVEGKGINGMNSLGQSTTPLDKLLNADGTLNLRNGFNGSVDPTGWTMLTGAGGQPRFVPAGSGGRTMVASVPMSGQDSLSRQVPPPVPPLGVTGGNWDGRFALPAPGLGGSSVSISDIAASDSDLYVGGIFATAGGLTVNNVAKWNSNSVSWFGLGLGTGSGANNAVSAMAVSGNTLYVSGSFSQVGGVAGTGSIAKWDGTNWKALGTGVTGVAGCVKAIGVSGSDVYVGGSCTKAGGVANTGSIARWDGTNWKSMGTWVPATNGTVTAIGVGGSDVYVGGSFTQAGGVLAYHIAKYNKISNVWSPLGTGITGWISNSTINAIGVINANNVYVGGSFIKVGGVAGTGSIARWDGTSWKALGTGVTGGIVNDIAVSSSNVYVGGSFTKAGGVANTAYIASWNGTNWLSLGSGVYGSVNAVAVRGNTVYAGGNFTTAGEVPVNKIASWNISTSLWSPIASWGLEGISGSNASVHAIAKIGDDLYVGGSFTKAGGVLVNRVAKWDGINWSALGSGVSGDVNAMAVKGNALYAGGLFTSAGGVLAKKVAAWNGANWLPVGLGVDGNVNAIVADDGWLFVGGQFTKAGGKSANNIAFWIHSIWETGGFWANGPVHAIGLRVGPLPMAEVVYIGGQFTAVKGGSANNIAKWFSSSPALGDGANGPVYAIAASGTDLYVGGSFTTVGGGYIVNHIAKWDGVNWYSFGDGVNRPVGVNGPVYAIAVNGTDLYVGGSFTTAGGVSANNIAKWNGSGSTESWSALGSGVNGTVKAIGLIGYDLYVGGSFTKAGGQPSSNFGLWHIPCQDPCVR